MIPSALSLSYSPTPLKIVRGQGTYLFDETGRRYTDCVNNVPHVGHSHPAVCAAISKQLSELNTNSRYLHDALLDFAAELTATLPPPLRYVVLTCSGSDANDLALRICRSVTGHKGVITVGCAYHGNTQSLIDISAYKNEGPGGEGAPPTTYKAMSPDTFRGPCTDPAIAGEFYAADVQRCVKSAEANSHGTAAFICESIQSCGGQIFLPPGYLQAVYRHVRAAGGLCIADEVQTGCGRVGTHFWAFETQGVVPDIVTIGKPIGNGFPVSAVVMTPELAHKFLNGMEYFNTYGGNPVAAVAGLAVLRVIREEKLQANALVVGKALLDGFRALQAKYPLIGDVRGMGLFIGIELVCSDKRTPAAAEARQVILMAKEAGFLLSTDGPDRNVIKIKPPMCFSLTNARELLAVLDPIFKGIPVPVAQKSHL